MIEGLKVSDKLCPISGSPIVNVSRVRWDGMFIYFFLKGQDVFPDYNSITRPTTVNTLKI